MESKAFTDCTLAYLEDTFGLVQQFDCLVLNEWLNEPAVLSNHEQRELRDAQELLTLNVLHWNEQELSMNFIGPVMALFRFTDRRFNLFANRPLRAIIGEIELYGRPDACIATGFREPKVPFFAFHVYKREIEPSGHPAAQALAAMLAAQHQNQQFGSTSPIYGCYVNGRDWSFMTLIEKTYCISPDYSALTNDIFEIFRILKTLKSIVTERVGELAA